MHYITVREICQPLISAFFKKLSDGGVHFLIAQKFDDQPVGKTDDIGAAVAEAPLYAVVIRAVGPGDGDLPVRNGDGIFAVYGEFLIDLKIHGFDLPAPGGDFGEAGLLLRKEGKGQKKTGSGNGCKEDDPGFCFHIWLPFGKAM